MVLEENGIFGVAQRASKDYKEAEIKEQIKLAYTTGMTEYYINKTDVEKTMQKELRQIDENAEVSKEAEKYIVRIYGAVYEIENGEIRETIEDKYMPKVLYYIKASANDEDEMEREGNLEEGTRVYIDVRVALQEGVINSIIPGEGLSYEEEKSEPSEGKYVYSVTKGGVCKLTITSNDGTENRYVKEEKIQVEGIYKEIITADNVHVEVGTGTNHEGKELNYTWSELVVIAEEIANNRNITKDTTEVVVNGVKIGVGDYTKIKYGNVDKKVRIIGFNHDDLSDNETETVTGKAGITFEFITVMERNIRMNSTDTAKGGWAECAIRNNMATYLTQIYTENPELQGKIKEVQKKYNRTCDQIDIQVSTDRLWLLACSEIWNNGSDMNNDVNYGYSKGNEENNEGDRYRYFEIVVGDTFYRTAVAELQKYKVYNPSEYELSTGGETIWLRSPWCESYGVDGVSFCGIEGGMCQMWGASYAYNCIAPAFCI